MAGLVGGGGAGAGGADSGNRFAVAFAAVAGAVPASSSPKAHQQHELGPDAKARNHRAPTAGWSPDCGPAAGAGARSG